MTAVTLTGTSEQTQTVASDTAMATLLAAAEAKNEHAFGVALNTIDWQRRPPADFLHAIDLALTAGAYLAARRLANQGTTQYPQQRELQKLAQLLAPPKVTVGTSGHRANVEANRVWLRAHWEQYRGQWVALRNGELLGVADSLDALVTQIGSIKSNDTLVTALW